MFSVHLFACIFFKVKEVSASSHDDVLDFYVSRNIAENVHFALYLFPIVGHDVNLRSMTVAGPCISICELST
jgi:hypothetical protein